MLNHHSLICIQFKIKQRHRENEARGKIPYRQLRIWCISAQNPCLLAYCLEVHALGFPAFFPSDSPGNPSLAVCFPYLSSGDSQEGSELVSISLFSTSPPSDAHTKHQCSATQTLVFAGSIWGARASSSCFWKQLIFTFISSTQDQNTTYFHSKWKEGDGS